MTSFSVTVILIFATRLQQLSQQDSKTVQRAIHHLPCSCEQAYAPGEDMLQERGRPVKQVRGPGRRRRSGTAHIARPKWCSSLGLTLKAGMLSVKREKQKEGERGEGGRYESRGDMCLTLRKFSGSNLHIYDHSPEWLHCERTTTTKRKKKKL